MKARRNFVKTLKRDAVLWMMALPALLLIFTFCYIPMYGVLMAFQNYVPSKGILGSDWVGFKHFRSFFNDPFCWRTIRNTVLLGVYSLLITFPAPIALAVLFNELKQGTFKRVAQTVSYMPHFVSTVIVVGLLKEIFSLSGIANQVIETLGGEAVSFMIDAKWFRAMYIGSGIWQGVGYSSIIYLAAISGINQELYESAVLDGASRWRRIISITIPCIMPTIQIMFIFAMGSLLANDFQKILLMYSESTYETADVISTYVYRRGLMGGQFSYSAAVGLLNSVISFVLLWTTNQISRKLNGETLY